MLVQCLFGTLERSAGELVGRERVKGEVHRDQLMWARAPPRFKCNQVLGDLHVQVCDFVLCLLSNCETSLWYLA